ncbi:Pleckstrin -like proteiny domain-containing family A member 8 [Channa argus]|uniref:Pleckstrin homology domain-containing family A member 8 n=1 Tax=Channa argus TaxID=215402 RepID=A0A6G1PPA1_CHAAH|nr:Pleckstrin -like proteiny domain-containing family A member 8 [Channa argus]
MEGILYKWTNYISGWQPRWFVLDGGTLSYYDSQEDAWKGCKGSIKISVCEIQVHSSDSTRVDLTIPGEQYFYLKAINAAERQKWLVALGTAKACLTDNRTKREKELQENTEALKTKMSELRLYCDLLLQQVNKIKDSDELGNATEVEIDTGNMVKSTCTTFLKTLEECMQIANRTFSADMATQSPPGSPPVAAIKPQKVKPVNQLNQNIGEKFSDIRLDDDNGIPTQEFLDSCYAIVPVLDKLGSTVFAPVKMDFVGNIKKIHQKLMSEPDSFPTLQSIVLHEIQTDVSQVRNSATEALLWLRRGLKFLKEFLSEVNRGEQDIQGALNNAYGKTLRQYHGWVVRGVFALALRAAPSYQSFTAALVSREGDELKTGFIRGIHRDLGMYLPAMERQLAILDGLYEEHNLESDEVV